MDEKKSFVLYLDNIKPITKFTDEQAGLVMKAILEYQLHGNKIIDFNDLAVEIVVDRIIDNCEKHNDAWVKQRKIRQDAGKKGGLAKAAKHKAKLPAEPINNCKIEELIAKFDFSLFPNNHKEPIINWIKYQYSRKKIKTELTITSLQRSLLRYLKDGKDIPRAIDDTISNPSWKGLTFKEHTKNKATMRNINDPTEDEIKF